MSHVYFISGHLDITEEDFSVHYKEKIDQALKDNKDVKFVIGDAKGADSFAQKYLIGKRCDVTIYHMYDSPLNNLGGYFTVGGFQSHEEKDSAMTYASSDDIAWFRTVEEQKKLYGNKYRKRVTGTEKNVKRRLNFTR